MDAQKQQILDHLKRGNAITPMGALRLYGCFRLAARIHDLRADGHDIVTIKEPTEDGKYVARYKLQ